MLQRAAYRFGSYPEPEQASLFRRTAGCCRIVYNFCLEQRRLERQRSDPRRITAAGQMKELKGLKEAAPEPYWVCRINFAYRDGDEAVLTARRETSSTPC